MTKKTLGAMVLMAMIAVTASATVEIVATHAVFGEIATIVGGETVDVTTIIPSGFCPSHYDLSPSDLSALLRADLVLYSGMEPWVEQLTDTVGEGALVQLVGPWNTPPMAAAKTQQIADLVTEQVPEHAELIEANRDAYVAQLDELGERLLAEAAALEIGEIPVVCMQWQASFVSWLGFQVPVTYGIPDTLSLRDLVELAEAGTEAGAVLVIDNLQSGIEFGGKLAREVDAVHVVLSNFPGAMPRTATLIDLLARNAAALFTAIEPIE